MADDKLVLISDEQAKLGQEVVGASRELGGYLADILGDLPKDLVGLIAGDRVKALRAERIAILWGNVKKRLEDRGVKQAEPLSLKLALPILAAAADENREELLNLWERLLAAAMDPNRQGFVRQSLISTVRQMDPFDVLVFKAVADNGAANWTPNGRDSIAARLQKSADEVLVSFNNLERLNCIVFVREPKIDPLVSPLGKLLIRAIA